MSGTGPALAAEVATKVMGWHTSNAYFDTAGRKFWFNANDERQCLVETYRPDLNIAQAIETLQRFPTWQITRCADGHHWCKVWNRAGVINETACEHAKAAEEAICRAALAAERS